jgi:hypothetical protein
MSGFTAAETSRTVPVQTLAQVCEDRAENLTRAAEQTDNPVFRSLLLKLALQWKQLAAQEEAKSNDTPTSASTQSTPQRTADRAR